MDCIGIALHLIFGRSIAIRINDARCPVLSPEFRTALISSAPRKRRKNPRTVTTPEHVGPHVKLVFAEMARQRMTYDSLEERSGVRRATRRRGVEKNRPGLESLEAALATLGSVFVPSRRSKRYPPTSLANSRLSRSSCE
jgi:hypothetical protein